MKNQTKYFFIVAGLFLGLSPINEPHLIGKVKWVVGGAIGMKPMDWFDFIMHGSALLVALALIVTLVFSTSKKRRKQ